MGWTRKQQRFVILRVFTPSLDFLDPPPDRNVFLGGLPRLSFPLASVPESLSQAEPVWCGVQARTCRRCPALPQAAAVALRAPAAGAAVDFAALLSFASTSPQSPPGSLHLFVTVPMSVSAAAVADTAVCFLSSFLSLHLS